MGAFSEMFTGKAAKRARQDAAAARADAKIAAARQRQDLQQQEQETAKSMSAVARAPRGRRLLSGDDAGGLGSSLG